MRKPMATSLILIPMLMLMLTGCTQSPRLSPETAAFQDSPLQRELNAGLDRCMELKAAGKLPGLAAGMRPDEEYSSGGYDLSRSRDLRYPLRLNCGIASAGKHHSFTLVKHDAGSVWALSKIQ